MAEGGRLTIEMCGKLADFAGRDFVIDLPAAGLTLDAVIAWFEQSHPELGAALAGPRIRACIDEQIVPLASIVLPGQSLAFFPPVSGG